MKLRYLLALLPSLALAQSSPWQIVLDWTPSFQNTDGTPIQAAQQPLSYNIYAGTQPNSYTQIASGVTANTYTVIEPGPGTWYFAVRTVGADNTVATPDVSDLTNAISATLSSIKPNAPTHFGVQ